MVKQISENSFVVRINHMHKRVDFVCEKCNEPVVVPFSGTIDDMELKLNQHVCSPKPHYISPSTNGY